MEDQLSQGERLLNDFLSQIVNWAPKLIGALLILIIGYFIAKGVASLVRRALEGAKLNERMHSGQGGNIIQRAIPDPSNTISAVVYWVIFLGALTLGFGALGIPLLTDLIRGIYSYLPNVLAALLIFLVASAISAGVAGFVANVMGDTPTGKIVAAAAPVLVMGLAVFMILNQLNIAPEIVTITYAALVGSVALGSALAFGLGGRDVAGRLLDDAYDKTKQNTQQVKHDLNRGTSRATAKADKYR